MAYTVKQVAKLSGVSVRTLHFYDEAGILKPAYIGANGYRYYDEPQLLILQQILFYRELGLELKQIEQILRRADFEKVVALESHREILRKNLARTQALLETIDKTIHHLKGTRKMNSQEMFVGFHVAAGKDRFGQRITLAGEPSDCKVSAEDTGGAMCIFEFSGAGSGPRHLHHDQDEWVYVISGDLQFEVGNKQFRAGAGESLFLPRNTPHAWASAPGTLAKILNVYQPAGKMEEFFREVGRYTGKPYVHEALSFGEFCRLFQDHGMKVVGPPLTGEWKVEDGRIIQIA